MRTFGYLFLGLLLMSLVAWATAPDRAPVGKTPLVWVSDDNPCRREHIDLFNQLNPDLHLILDPDNAGQEKVIVQATGGVGPDLFDCYGINELRAYVGAGIAWDVTDELAKMGVDVRASVWPAMLPYVELDGRVYGFPANTATDALFFNKDIFDEAGIPYPKSRPWTWEEFIPLAQRLTVRDANGRVKQYGCFIDFWQWRFFVRQWGGRVFSPDGTRCEIDSPQCIAAMRFLQDLIYKYKVMPSPSEEDAMMAQGGWGSAGIRFIGGRRVATAIGGRWWLSSLRQYTSLRLGAVEAPHGPVREFLSYGKSTLINRKSPRREQALKFLQYMAGPQYNRLINLQADGMGPVKSYCTDENLINPRFPQEDFHPVYREIQEAGFPDEISPFANANAVGRLIGQQYELIRLNAKSPEDAMREAARQVNELIAKELKRDPELKARYDAVVARRGEREASPRSPSS